MRRFLKWVLFGEVSPRWSFETEISLQCRFDAQSLLELVSVDFTLEGRQQVAEIFLSDPETDENS